MSTLGSSISMPVRRISVPLPLAVAAAKARPNHFQTSNGLISRAWSWIQARQAGRSSTRRLQVAETISLGEKRFVAVVKIDGRQFLVGGGPGNVALLAQLDSSEEFGDVLKETMDVPKKPSAKRIQKPIEMRAAGRGSKQA